MIDLHLHTTASDGVLRPAALVERAAAAGLRTIAVTDHDTTGGLAEARARAATAGITLIDGIEITAVEAGRDVHVLGYFIDTTHGPLLEFLTRQRQDRVRRIREIAERLEDARRADRPGTARRPGGGRGPQRRAVRMSPPRSSRPDTSRGSTRRSRGTSRMTVPRSCRAAARAPKRSSRSSTRAGGVASLAHPGLTRIDPRLPDLAGAGLDALEVRHSEHDAETEARYRATAVALGLAVTAGSDFHGDHGVRASAMGRITMSELELAGLMERRP